MARGEGSAHETAGEGIADMSRKDWHVLREGLRLTLARRLPARFDVEARASLPGAGRLRLATLIRQDIWRALRRQRGFSPVVEVTASPAGLTVRAGGLVDGAPYDRAGLEALVAAVLEAPANRTRWLRGIRSC